MAESAEAAATASTEAASSSEPETRESGDEGPSVVKRRKLSDARVEPERLEQRLGSILCCAVCLDLPTAAVYQCTNGHLMCASCFTHLLADARLRDEAATCPNCRIEISKGAASRNLAVEKAVSELPSDCRFCSRVYPRHSLQHHEEVVCDERASRCRYLALGCGWEGPAHEAAAHAAGCGWPARPASDALPALAAAETAAEARLRAHRDLLDLLSLEKIAFNDLQLKPYRTDEFVHRLYYETSRFAAFNLQWVVKAFVNGERRDPTDTAERRLTYQLVLKSKPALPVSVQYVWLRGPLGELSPPPAVHAHLYRDEEPAPPPHELSLPADSVNRLLAAKHIHLRFASSRLIMFLSNK